MQCTSCHCSCMQGWAQGEAGTSVRMRMTEARGIIVGKHEGDGEMGVR